MRELTTWESLQTLVGTTSEGADLDFKEILDPSQGKIEFAKDVAALANVLGGHLLRTIFNEPRSMGRCRCRWWENLVDVLQLADQRT